MKRFLLLIPLILLLLCSPAIAQDLGKVKFAVLGVSAQGTKATDIQGFGIFGYPITEKVISYTRVDFSVVEGVTLDDLFHNEGLQTNVRTGLAYRIFKLNSRLSLWGLGTTGLAFGGPEGSEGQTVISGSFGGGGFVQYRINDRLETQLILEVAKNSATGTQFAPAGAVRINLP